MTTYHGSCHCGAVRYDVELEIGRVIACNCSICKRTGALLAFVPEPAFTLVQGQDALQDYRFNKHVVQHLFCQTCGVRSFGRGSAPDGTKMVAINVRCLEGVDLDALEVRRFDGASL
jgi:hypothetical protein